MNVDYKDIISRIGKPLWYDRRGVPRYEEFKPNSCAVYNDYITYMEVACQECDERFFVASEISFLGNNVFKANFSLPIPPLKNVEKKISEVEEALDNEVDISPWGYLGSFHYGDPPRHGMTDNGCLAGDTMNSVPIRIIEFWEKDKKKTWEWKRNPKYEFVIVERKQKV